MCADYSVKLLYYPGTTQDSHASNRHDNCRILTGQYSSNTPWMFLPLLVAVLPRDIPADILVLTWPYLVALLSYKSILR